MKILIVSQYFWPEQFIINSLAVELKTKGHDISVLTGLPNYPQGKFFTGYSFLNGPWKEDFQGVTVHRVPLLARGQGFFRLALNYVSFVFFGVLLGRLRASGNYDVIFCYAPSPVTGCLPAIALKFICKKPLVFWVQDLWPESIAAVGAAKSDLVLKAVGRLVRFIYRRCDLILMQSQAFKQSILQWGGVEEKLLYVPNWAKVAPISSKTPHWLKNVSRGFKIVFAGNIGRAQAMPTILKAAEILKHHQDIHWLIVGDGSEKKLVDEEIKNLRLEECVFTFGRRPNEDMPGLLSLGDVMLVSLTDTPIFALTIPSKVQGYMASGKPILAALNGEGAKVVLEAKAGIACAAEDADALAKTVLEFYQMPVGDRERMGKNGFEYFKAHFEEALVISQIEAAFEKVKLPQ